jgi:lysine 6-dehydrogenase
MKILVLGGGMMGMAAAWDLSRSHGVKQVGIADVSRNVLNTAIRQVGRPNVLPHHLDVTDLPRVKRLMRRYDATIGAVSYRYNYQLACCAIQAGCHYCDLGGNDDIVARQFQLHAAAKRRKVRIVPDCGLAPGMVSIVVAEGLRKLARVDSVFIRVGGLPQKPEPPMNYQLVFSVGGLINEYVEPARILHNGKLMTVESMTGLEELNFPRPFGTLEAFYTSGGASTLPLTLKGKVQELNYKTIRYPGHCEKIKTMIDLGLASRTLVRMGPKVVEPRQVFERLLANHLPSGGPDCVLIRVTLQGRAKTGQGRRQISYQLIDYYDPETTLTAMMRMTSFPVSIVAQMLCRGDVAERACGVLRQEVSIPPDVFLNELTARGICFEYRNRAV